MGNRVSQLSKDDEETEPILSDGCSAIQSKKNAQKTTLIAEPNLCSDGTATVISASGYGSNSVAQNGTVTDQPVLSTRVAQNGRKKSRSSVKLKTEEKKDPKAVRKPFEYKPGTGNSRNSNDDAAAAASESGNEDDHYIADAQRRGFARRLHYFHRLDRRPDSSLAMPDHVVPEDFWERILGPAENKHNSIVTIFSLWNTMMGTSLLSMPWAIQQAGFVGGVILLVVMALIMFYTSYLVLKSVNIVPGKKFNEFSEACEHFVGKFASSLATFSSLVTLLGGMIVYWILLSNFLYHIVVFIHNKAYPVPSHNVTGFSSGDFFSSSYLYSNSSSPVYPDVICKGGDNSTSAANGTSKSTFDKVWTEDLTVPILLSVLLICLVNFKSATIFTKLNSLGVVSVLYLLIFTCVKAGNWGMHLHLGWKAEVPYDDHYYVPDFKVTFPALTGICALAYFVQNCVIAITRNNKHPENNVRDLSIAYFLVAFCYIFVGAMIYVSFPLAKYCIQDNFLNNIAADDMMTFIAHILLFFQMTCVFPLLTFILRSQFFLAIFGTVWPSFKHVIALTVVLFSICIIFAIFLPHIGRIISFVGAFCGLAYAIALPCCVYMKAQKKNGTLTMFSLILHSTLIVIGAANFIAQFLIIGKTS